MNDLWLLFKDALEKSGPVAVVEGALIIVVGYALFRAIPAIFVHFREQAELHKSELQELMNMHKDGLLKATEDHKRTVQSVIDAFERTLIVVNTMVTEKRP